MYPKSVTRPSIPNRGTMTSVAMIKICPRRRFAFEGMLNLPMFDRPFRLLAAVAVRVHFLLVAPLVVRNRAGELINGYVTGGVPRSRGHGVHACSTSAGALRSQLD